MLCGEPIGRIMHPILAAMVSKAMANINKSILFSFFKANIVNGANMINATSLVMNIDEKKIELVTIK